MRQQGAQRPRRQPACRGGGDKPGEDAQRARRQRLAAGVVDLDVPAQQLAAHAARQLAVRRHQSRRAARRLQHLAHDDGDAEGLLALIGRLDEAHRG